MRLIKKLSSIVIIFSRSQAPPSAGPKPRKMGGLHQEGKNQTCRSIHCSDLLRNEGEAETTACNMCCAVDENYRGWLREGEKAQLWLYLLILTMLQSASRLTLTTRRPCK